MLNARSMFAFFAILVSFSHQLLASNLDEIKNAAIFVIEQKTFNTDENSHSNLVNQAKTMKQFLPEHSFKEMFDAFVSDNDFAATDFKRAPVGFDRSRAEYLEVTNVGRYEQIFTVIGNAANENLIDARDFQQKLRQAQEDNAIKNIDIFFLVHCGRDWPFAETEDGSKIRLVYSSACAGKLGVAKTDFLNKLRAQVVIFHNEDTEVASASPVYYADLIPMLADRFGKIDQIEEGAARAVLADVKLSGDNFLRNEIAFTFITTLQYRDKNHTADDIIDASQLKVLFLDK